MKKILSLILVLVLSLACLASCANPGTGDGNGDENDNTANTYTVAIATESVELSSRSGSKLGNNFAVVVFDKDGKIVAADFDSTEIAAPTVDESGAIVAQDIASKVESNYKKGSMQWTWGEQATAFANFIKGKTAAEVADLDVTTEGLVTGCTMASTSYSSMLNFQALVAKAAASEHKQTFESETEDFKIGAGMSVSVAFNWSGAIEVTADCSGAVVGADGKVVAVVIDTIVQSYAVADDKTTTLNTIVESKLAQGDAYDAYNPMDAGRWYQQIDAFGKTAIGKTATELADLATEDITGCTINVDMHKVVLIKAVNDAK